MSEEDVLDLLNAVEAAIVQYKQRAAKRHGVNKEETKTNLMYDLSKIKTEKTEGPSGFYQKVTEQDSEDYRLLIDDLKRHDGKLTRDGQWIWLFDDGKTIGMKPSKK